MHVQLALGTVHRFDVAVFAFGALLMLGALASGITRRSFLTMTPVFVLIGFAALVGAILVGAAPRVVLAEIGGSVPHVEHIAARSELLENRYIDIGPGGRRSQA